MEKQETKLTAISLLCRGKVIMCFRELPLFSGKPVLHQSKINELFQQFHGFIPERGETVSFL